MINTNERLKNKQNKLEPTNRESLLRGEQHHFGSLGVTTDKQAWLTPTKCIAVVESVDKSITEDLTLAKTTVQFDTIHQV